MKKEKKQKQQVEELVLGKKIRDVKINERQHFLLYVSMLVLFNILMISSAWFVLIRLNSWYYWVVCVTIVGICLGLSFKSYIEIKNFHKCEIYDNAIAVNSIWFNMNIELKDIYEMRVKESVLDKMFKLNTKSLEMKILCHRRKKFTIHFIEENAVKLKQEITILIDRYSQKQGGAVAENKTEEKKKTKKDA